MLQIYISKRKLIIDRNRAGERNYKFVSKFILLEAKDVKVCKVCGAVMQDKDTFCWKCGATS
jgi:hypothetical protein